VIVRPRFVSSPACSHRRYRALLRILRLMSIFWMRSGSFFASECSATPFLYTAKSEYGIVCSRKNTRNEVVDSLRTLHYRVTAGKERRPPGERASVPPYLEFTNQLNST
jgi:hypothetical protein